MPTGLVLSERHDVAMPLCSDAGTLNSDEESRSSMGILTRETVGDRQRILPYGTTSRSRPRIAFLMRSNLSDSTSS